MVERNVSRNMTVNIIGAGLAGLSAALTLAKLNIACNLVSLQPSERAQSVLAAGGINGALDTMGENDTVREHISDTMRAGGYISDEGAVTDIAEHAPDIIRELAGLGVPFHSEGSRLILRNFGGQKKKRTAFAKSSTGRMIMTALIDEARKYEANGIIRRYAHHEFIKLIQKEAVCCGAWIRDTYAAGEQTPICLLGPVILAVGGMNGIFPEMTTGTTANSGDAVAAVFRQGVMLSNLEMIQYHPTTIAIAGKRCLISEAARGEGGRLYIRRNHEKWYFMEDRYPELGNLMPRDVVSKEMDFCLRNTECEPPVYLDMTGISKEIWKSRLSDLRDELIYYLSIDPAKSPIPVSPGIHYFMGGIDVDRSHATGMPGLFAAGECCSQYHGANRLGGNSLLGAIYGGKRAALSTAEYVSSGGAEEILYQHAYHEAQNSLKDMEHVSSGLAVSEKLKNKIRDILSGAMGIVRNEKSLEKALYELNELEGEDLTEREQNRVLLARAILLSAIHRRESRGAHFREDYPAQDPKYQGLVTALFDGKQIKVGLKQSTIGAEGHK
ncbi:MAG: FAD-binding protein [Lachnospiraceae bacterium]|nr:FAD-binding protein [Lachnospiraceae bacterium]